MTEKATVVEIKDKSRAIVEVQRSSACEGCHKKAENGECSVCSLLGGDKAFRAEVLNPVGARIGDVVTVESSGGRMLFYAALIFIFPILLSLAAYFAAGCFLDSEKLRSLGWRAECGMKQGLERTVEILKDIGSV